MFLLNCSTRFQLISMDFAIDLAIFTKALPMDRRTNRPTDQPTDGRTYPLIEMRQRHLKMAVTGQRRDPGKNSDIRHFDTQFTLVHHFKARTLKI